MANLRLLALKIRTENKIFLRPDFDKLVKTAKSYGWLVKSYKEAEAFIKYHKLEESTKIHRAFAYEYNDEIVILYRDGLEGDQLLFAIAHEIVHLVLHHDENKHDTEDEADEFARLLIGNYTYLKKASPIMIVALILVTTFIVKACSKSNIVINNKVIPSSQTESATIEKPTQNQEIKTEETFIADPEHTVYITKSGDKYHSADCYHINVDNCTMLSETQAVSLGYEPCKTCRPDVEVIQKEVP